MLQTEMYAKHFFVKIAIFELLYFLEFEVDLYETSRMKQDRTNAFPPPPLPQCRLGGLAILQASFCAQNDIDKGERGKLSMYDFPWSKLQLNSTILNTIVALVYAIVFTDLTIATIWASFKQFVAIGTARCIWSLSWDIFQCFVT